MNNNMDNVNCAEKDSQTAVVHKLSELPQNLSKRQLKKVKKKEKWLERKVEKRLEKPRYHRPLCMKIRQLAYFSWFFFAFVFKRLLKTNVSFIEKKNIYIYSRTISVCNPNLRFKLKF